MISCDARRIAAEKKNLSCVKQRFDISTFMYARLNALNCQLKVQTLNFIFTPTAALPATLNLKKERIFTK
jgi:hypothetical protein